MTPQIFDHAIDLEPQITDRIVMLVLDTTEQLTRVFEQNDEVNRAITTPAGH
jgi:hypothetical protein